MKENVRKQGILLPVSSIPSAYGIGTFGRESYRFVDFLEKSGNRLWQILPLGPTGYGDSPYQSFSTFAGNPYYIDLELLIEEGLLTKEICDGYDFGDNEHYVDYEKIYLSRFKVLKIAFENAKKQGLMDAPEYQKFITDNAYWLDELCPVYGSKKCIRRRLLYGMGRGYPFQKSGSASQVPQKALG